MTACALNMHQWIEDFRASVAAQIAQIHPSAQCICHEYFGDMHAAAHAGDPDELARLVRLTQDKIADELFWEEEKRRSAVDPSYRVRHFRG
jgi:hypothetical protein